LAPENFARFITDINILETFYNVIVSETEDKNLELLTSLIFQTEHFNHLFYDQPSFEYIVKFCYHNHSFMSPDQKNKVFSLIQTGKIDFHLFITNFSANENCIDVSDEEIAAEILNRVIQIILNTFGDIFPSHDEIFNQPTLQLACKKIK